MEQKVDDFHFEWHGNVLVVVPAQNVENLRWDLIEHAAQSVIAPLQKAATPTVVFDLSSANYFGSVFLSLLLQCHKFVKERGGDLALCGASALARELLSVTALDTLWAIYETRADALKAFEV